MTDIEVNVLGRFLVELISNSKRGDAWLRMIIDPMDQPTPGSNGHLFIAVRSWEVEELLQKAKLAGLSCDNYKQPEFTLPELSEVQRSKVADLMKQGPREGKVGAVKFLRGEYPDLTLPEAVSLINLML